MENFGGEIQFIEHCAMENFGQSSYKYTSTSQTSLFTKMRGWGQWLSRVTRIRKFSPTFFGEKNWHFS
jgi:hypothetical protein